MEEKRNPVLGIKVGTCACLCLPPAKAPAAAKTEPDLVLPKKEESPCEKSGRTAADLCMKENKDLILMLETVRIGRGCCVSVRAWLEGPDGTPCGRTVSWPAKLSHGTPAWYTARAFGLRTSDHADVLRIEVSEEGSAIASLTLPFSGIPALTSFTRSMVSQSPCAVTLRVLDPETCAGRRVVYFIRHGESLWNQAQSNFDVYGLLRTTDHGLSDTGRAQAEALAERLRQVEGTDFSSMLRPDAILVSPLVRAIETAVIVLGGVAVQHGPSDWLLMANAREKQNLGGLDSTSSKLGSEIVNATRDELRALYGNQERGVPATLEKLKFETREVDDRWWAEGMSDSPERLRERASEFMSQLLYSPHRVAIVVGHSHFFRSVFREYLSDTFKVHSPQLSADLGKKKLCNCGVARLELEHEHDALGGPIVSVELMPGTSMEADATTFGALNCCGPANLPLAEGQGELRFPDPGLGLD